MMDDREPGRHAEADQVEQADIGRADDEGDGEVEAAEQRHQGLADAGEAEERGEQQHRLDVVGRDEAVDLRAIRPTNSPTSTIRPMKALRFSAMNLPSEGGEDDQPSRIRPGDDREDR